MAADLRQRVPVADIGYMSGALDECRELGATVAAGLAG
jgi:hypothetical protein